MTGLNWMASGISSILSVISFFVLKFFHIVAAFPGVIIVLSALGIISAFAFWTRKDIARWIVFSVSIVMLALTSWNMNRNDLENAKANEMELIADATETGVSWISDPKSFKSVQDSSVWFMPAVLEDQMMYVLIPSNLSVEAVGRNAMDPKKIPADFPYPGWGVMSPFYGALGEVFEGEYVLAGFYKPQMKDGYKFKRCKVLPESVAITIRGMAFSKTDMMEAKRLWEIADSLGNPVATEQIADMYASGKCVNRDLDKAKAITKRAAIDGCRKSRLFYGKAALLDSTYSVYDKTVAENLLKRAAVISTIVSRTVSNYSQEATDFLCEYYWHTKRYEDAYQLTKQSMASYPNPNVLYVNHLYNCLYTDRIEEAKSIVEEGEQKGNPNAYIMHAEMIRQGAGYEKDFAQAESLVNKGMFTALEINQPVGSMANMFYFMHDLFLDAADSTGAHFWRRLAEIDYHLRVDDDEYDGK